MPPNPFPSMRGRALFALLAREPLSYAIVRQKGSHRRLESSRGYPPLLFAFHDGDSIPPGLVRKVLVKDVGLSVDEAVAIL